MSELDYDRYPNTYDELRASVAGQLRRKAELGQVPYEESVVVTVEAVAGLIDIIEDLRQRVSELSELALGNRQEPQELLAHAMDPANEVVFRDNHGNPIFQRSAEPTSEARP